MEITVQEFVYGAKCRCCGYNNTWYFGNSDTIKPNYFLDAMKEKLNLGTFKYCDLCNANMIFDLTFYGNMED